MSSDVSEAVFLLETLARELAEPRELLGDVYDELLASASTAASGWLGGDGATDDASSGGSSYLLRAAAPPPSGGRYKAVSPAKRAARPPQDRVSFQKAQCLKTKPCQFFLQNRCSRGASCTFAHNSQELRFKPDLTKTKICTLWAAGKCRLNPCNYAHGWHELRPLNPH